MCHIEGGEVKELVLWPCGGLTITGPKDGDPRDDVKAAIAGPIFQIPMLVAWFLILWLCYHINGGNEISLNISESHVAFFGNVAFESYRLNAILILVNVCIPMYPFDAVRIVGGLIIVSGMNASASAKITASITFVVSALIGIIGI